MSCGRVNGAGDGTGDVMEFQVQEESLTSRPNSLQDGGTFGAEELETDLVVGDVGWQAVDGVKRVA